MCGRLPRNCSLGHRADFTKTTDGDLVNCFLPKDNLFMVMMSTNTIVADMYFAGPAVIKSTIGALRCCCPARDGENIKFVFGYESKT